MCSLSQNATEGGRLQKTFTVLFGRGAHSRMPGCFEELINRGCHVMNGHVLVLNQDYSALTVCGVERAVVLMYLQKVHLVESVDGKYVHAPSVRIPWPSIIRLKAYVRIPYKHVVLSRKNVMRRDRSRCQYCGSSGRLTIDHVLPKSRGGKDTWENLVAACVPCNNRKGDRTPGEASMGLARTPFRPSHVMFIRDFVGTLNETWKPYLFLA